MGEGALSPSGSQVDFVGVRPMYFSGRAPSTQVTLVLTLLQGPRPSGFIFLVDCQAVRQLRSKKSCPPVPLDQIQEAQQQT